MNIFIKKHFVFIAILLKYNIVYLSEKPCSNPLQPSIRQSASRFFYNFTYKTAFRFPLSVFRFPLSAKIAFRFPFIDFRNVKFRRKLDPEKHPKKDPQKRPPKGPKKGKKCPFVTPCFPGTIFLPNSTQVLTKFLPTFTSVEDEKTLIRFWSIYGLVLECSTGPFSDIGLAMPMVCSRLACETEHFRRTKTVRFKCQMVKITTFRDFAGGRI